MIVVYVNIVSWNLKSMISYECLSLKLHLSIYCYVGRAYKYAEKSTTFDIETLES